MKDIAVTPGRVFDEIVVANITGRNGIQDEAKNAGGRTTGKCGTYQHHTPAKIVAENVRVCDEKCPLLHGICRQHTLARRVHFFLWDVGIGKKVRKLLGNEILRLVHCAEDLKSIIDVFCRI